MFLYVPLRIPLRHCTFPFISERFSLLVNQRVIQNILILENYHKITSHVLRNKQYYSLGTEKKGFFEFLFLRGLECQQRHLMQIPRILYIFDPIECSRFICLIYSTRRTLVKRGNSKIFYLHDNKCTKEGDK